MLHKIYPMIRITPPSETGYDGSQEHFKSETAKLRNEVNIYDQHSCIHEKLQLLFVIYYENFYGPNKLFLKHPATWYEDYLRRKWMTEKPNKYNCGETTQTFNHTMQLLQDELNHRIVYSHTVTKHYVSGHRKNK